MSDDSNMSEQEKGDIQRAIEESKRTAQAQALKMEPDLEEAIKKSLENNSPIESNCNKSEFYLQNRGQGNCLFESVAQIFYPVDIRDDSTPYSNVDDASDELRTMVYNFYQGINFFQGFPEDRDLNEKKRHSHDIQYDLVWATNEDLQILSYLLEFNYKIIGVHEEDLPQQNNSYENKYKYTFCNTILGSNDRGNHWVLKRVNDADRGEKYGSDDFGKMLATGNQKIEALKSISNIPNFYMNAIILQGARPPPPPAEPIPPPPAEQPPASATAAAATPLPASEPPVAEPEPQATETKEPSTQPATQKVIMYIFVGSSLVTRLDANKEVNVPVDELAESNTLGDSFTRTFRQIGLEPPAEISKDNLSIEINPHEIIYYV